MKKMMIISLVLVSQMALAQKAAKEIRRMTEAQAKTAVENSSTYKYIMDAKSKGKDITSDAIMRDRVSKAVEVVLKDVVVLETGASLKLVKMMDVSPKEVLSEITRLNSIIRDTTTSAADKATAKKTLRLIAKASGTVDPLAKNSSEARAEQAKVESIIKVSDKIAKLNLGEKSESFIKKYEKALAEGKSVEDAIKAAFSGKHTLKELLDCV